MSFNYKSKNVVSDYTKFQEKRNKFYQKNKDHAYYKRLEKQADYEVELGKFKEAEELYLKAADERKKHSEKYFPKKTVGKVSTVKVMRLDTMVLLEKHGRLEKHMKKRKKKMEKIQIQMSIIFGFTVRGEKNYHSLRDDLKAKHKRRTLTDYARQLRLNRK